MPVLGVLAVFQTVLQRSKRMWNSPTSNIRGSAFVFQFNSFLSHFPNFHSRKDCFVNFIRMRRTLQAIFNLLKLIEGY